jgi:hypothetical protein
MRFVPFTFALALGNLNRVYFGFRDHGLFITTVPYDELWLQRKSTIESLSKLIDSISASFCHGTLPPFLEIKKAWFVYSFRIWAVHVVFVREQRSCQSFPVKAVTIVVLSHITGKHH